MKLNYKRTLLVGFAFFLISLFWQAYDNVIPLILTNKFGMPQTLSGVIMALDNVLALFLLPLFGAISDRSTNRHGKRMPFIIVGTILSALLFVGLSVADARQLTKLENVTPDKYEASLSVIWDADPAISVPEADRDGMTLGDAVRHVFSSAKKQNLHEVFPDKADFTAIPMYEPDADGTPSAVVSAGYTDYVIPARNAYAWQQTVNSPVTLIFFILLLLCVLVTMGIFRSPAVALMPDVTPKPLRSKANAVICLMGSFGGVLVLVLGMIFGTGKAENALMNYIPFFCVCAGVMLAALAVLIFTVREPQWAAEANRINARLDAEDSSTGTEVSGERKLSPAERRSFAFILISVVLWFMGYNAVTSKYSVYAGAVLNMDYNLTLIIAQAAAIIAYFPIGILSSKLGRKKTILVGIIILFASFFTMSFIRAGSPVILMDVLFALAGIGWATISVNSYPMAVEMASGSNVGKYTGYYYTASMAAQVATPVLSGIFLDIRFTTLFPYGALFVALAFVTMLFVRHGDAKPDAAQTALDAMDAEG